MPQKSVEPVPGYRPMISTSVWAASSVPSRADQAADPALTFQITAGALLPGDAVSGALTRTPGEKILERVPR